jgi:protoheme IX farnesyltransferase
MFVRPSQKWLHFLTARNHSQLPTMRKTVKSLSELTKFKLSVLNSIVTVSAYCLYPVSVSCVPLFVSSLALSMSTQVLNQCMEIPYDKLMMRTCQRPMVQNVFGKPFALALGTTLGALGLYGLNMYNFKAAVIGGVIWFSYLAIYTQLKRFSTFNTILGAVVGSLTIYLGWVAAGRSICMVEPFALFMYMMAWQHQHFYGIRWIYFNDYNNAGFKMERSKQVATMITVGFLVASAFLLCYSLKYCELNYGNILSIMTVAGLYQWGIKATHDFERGRIDARGLKMQSYKHFMLIFGIVFANFLYRWYKGEEWKKPRNIAEGECILPYF